MNPSNPTSQHRSFPYVDRRMETLRKLGLRSLAAKKRDGDLAARVKAVVEARRRTA
jgi:hypothetical protein